MVSESFGKHCYSHSQKYNSTLKKWGFGRMTFDEASSKPCQVDMRRFHPKSQNKHMRAIKRQISSVDNHMILYNRSLIPPNDRCRLIQQFFAGHVFVCSQNLFKKCLICSRNCFFPKDLLYCCSFLQNFSRRKTCKTWGCFVGCVVAPFRSIDTASDHSWSRLAAPAQ